MQSITTRKGQCLFDLAVQLYGNVAATRELLRLNDFQGKFVREALYATEEMDLGYAIIPDTEVLYDETSPLINKTELLGIHGQERYDSRDGFVPATGITEAPLLLDGMDVKAAFSLRKLKSDYKGYAIRVRRSSDNTEQDIGFEDGTFELNVTAYTAFVGGGTGYVVKWYNQLGDGNDMYNTSASDQPKILLSHTPTGKPVVHFNVKRLFIAGNDTFNYLHNTKTYKVVGVLEFPNPQSIAVIMSSNNGGALDTGVQFRQYNNVTFGQITSNSVSSQVFSQFVNNFFDGLTIMNVDSVADGTISYRANGESKGTLVNNQPVPNANASTIMTIGKNNNNSGGGDMKLAELFFFDQSNSLVNTVIENNLSQYYGIS